MKRILVPISFSRASQNSLCQAALVFSKVQLTLLHVYPLQQYSRKYDFGKKNYAEGIREKLWEFYLQHIEHPDKKTSLLTQAGSISEVVDQISDRYDLMVMSRKGPFTDKKLFITTMARCPVLIMPITDTPFNFENCEHIWHIKQKETETEVVLGGTTKLGINPAKMEVKSLGQTSFLSTFWKNIVEYEKSHDKKLIEKIDNAHDEEPIDLIVLVDNEKSVFTNFFKSDVIHLFCKYDIPILVFPAK
jgi:nucleotide-binding universal stress UspA family protein